MVSFQGKNITFSSDITIRSKILKNRRPPYPNLCTSNKLYRTHHLCYLYQVSTLYIEDITATPHLSPPFAHPLRSIRYNYPPQLTEYSIKNIPTSSLFPPRLSSATNCNNISQQREKKKQKQQKGPLLLQSLQPPRPENV